MSTPVTGEQFTLRFGDHEAVITQLGATLRSYRVGNRDVIVPFPADVLPPAAHGKILAPWPNRIDAGAYEFDEVEYQLPINEVALNNAIHGLVSEHWWTPIDQGEAHVTCELHLAPSGGYPFPLQLTAAYQLDDDGLTLTFTATNEGASDAPYGVGFHPWLSPGEGSLDDCTLTIDAEQWLPTDHRLLPSPATEIPERLDFRSERQVADTTFDDAFPSATFVDGRSWVRLRGTDGKTAEAWLEEPLNVWQVCSGDDPAMGEYQRTGMAAEPMTCAANAFNTGDGLIRLAPGQSHTVRWGLGLR